MIHLNSPVFNFSAKMGVTVTLFGLLTACGHEVVTSNSANFEPISPRELVTESPTPEPLLPPVAEASAPAKRSHSGSRRHRGPILASRRLGHHHRSTLAAARVGRRHSQRAEPPHHGGLARVEMDVKPAAIAVPPAPVIPSPPSIQEATVTKSSFDWWWIGALVAVFVAATGAVSIFGHRARGKARRLQFN